MRSSKNSDDNINTSTHAIYDDSETDNSIGTPIDYYNMKPREESLIMTPLKRNSDQRQICMLCNNSKNITQYIILDCSHIYHVVCLTECIFGGDSAPPTIDETFLKTRKCPHCNVDIECDDLLILMSKMTKLTKTQMETHSKAVSVLESELDKIKLELKNSLDYKQKLEKTIDKYKDIQSYLKALI